MAAGEGKGSPELQPPAMPSSELVFFVVAMEVLAAAGWELFRGGDSQAVEQARPWLLQGKIGRAHV